MRAALVALLPLLLTTTACVEQRTAHPHARTQIEVVSAQVGGKNVFLPGTMVLTAGSGRSLSVFNTTGAPHGLEIPGLGVQVVLPPGEEFVVELPELRAKQVFEVRCHLHPPHRSATLLVVR